MKKIYFGRWGKGLAMMMIFCLVGGISWGQVAGDLRSTGTSNWNVSTTWERYNGSTWESSGVGANNPGQIPTTATSVFIQSSHTITLTTNASCYDFHIANSNTNSINPAFQGRVALATNTLNIYGKMRTYYGVVNSIPGTSDADFSNYPFTASTGKVSIEGNSRTILASGEWGATISNPNNGEFPLEINLNTGQIVDINESIKVSNFILNTGSLDTKIYRIGLDNGTTGQGDATVNSLGTLISSATGAGTSSIFSRSGTTRAGIFNLNGTMILSGANPTIQFSTINFNTGSNVELNRNSAQSFLSSTPGTHAGAVPIPNYYNLILSNSNTKTPAANFTVVNDITILGAASLPLGAFTATIGGDWTNYGTAGFTESTSTVIFNGSGAQAITTAGGEDFFKLNKTGTGTLTLNSDVRFGSASSELNISSGILDAGTNTLSGTNLTSLNMSGGILKLAKLGTTLPEFDIPAGYTLTGGTIELNGAGNQILRGSRDYRNLTFSTSGTKTVTSAPSSINGTITISNSAIVNVGNANMGGTGTNFTMNDNSRYITAGTNTKPDAGGIYSLAPTSTIEFSNNAGGQQDIRLTPTVGTVTYGNIDVSGSNVGLSGATSVLDMQPLTTFKVTSTGTFNVKSSNGFAGTSTTAINNTNSPTILLQPSSTINYDGAAQIITNTHSYHNLKLSGTGTKTAPASTLSIIGNLNKSTVCTFVHNSGTVSMDGTSVSSQTYTAVAPIMEFNNLIINNLNTSGFIISNDLGVETLLSLNTGSRLLFDAGNIHLRSTATKTAAVGQVHPSTVITYPGTGRFVVERYIPSGRRWRFLTSPVNSSQTVRQSWMENSVTAGDNIAPGYGTIVTDNLGTAMGNGFDGQSISGPSMKYYLAPAAAFTGILTPSDIITSKQGYMTYIRGDRASTPANAVLSSTILRSTGQLKTGLVPVSGVNAGDFVTIGNPYPSQIDLRTVYAASSGISPNFYVWDPKLTGNYGLGGYQTLALSGSDFLISPGGGSYTSTFPYIVNTIESGAAFLARTSAFGGSVNFNENAKLSGSNEVNFTGGNTSGLVDATLQYFSSNLFIKNAAGLETVVDGTMLLFGETENNGVDYNDAKKIANLNENVSVKRNNHLLAVERRNLPAANDTIFINTANLRIAEYSWKINTQNLNPALDAYLIDKFLQTTSLINAGAEYAVNFTVTNNAASYAADRFMILFKAAPVLPFSFTHLEANRMTNTNSVAIKFAVINSKNVVSYEVERSNNGTAFYKIAQNISSTNTANELQYVNADKEPLVFDNFYRIKAIYSNGNIVYSGTVKVGSVVNEENIVVFPNPVINRSVSFQAINLPVGEYNVEINNNEGKKLYVGIINVAANMQRFTVPLSNETATGTYYLLVSSGFSDKKYFSAIMVK